MDCEYCDTELSKTGGCPLCYGAENKELREKNEKLEAKVEGLTATNQRLEEYNATQAKVLCGEQERRIRAEAEAGKLETELAEAVKGIGELEAEVETWKDAVKSCGYENVLKLKAEVEKLKGSRDSFVRMCKELEEQGQEWYDGIVACQARIKELETEVENERESVKALGRSYDKMKALADELGEAAEKKECRRCEGSGRLWADGKAHYHSETRPTIPCGNCGGEGQTFDPEAMDEALAKWRANRPNNSESSGRGG